MAAPSSSLPDDLRPVVEQWLELDQNSANHAQVQQMVAEGRVDELHKLFLPRIEFGTAGLRGRMAPGYACMNDLIIIQTSQGLAEYVAEAVTDAQNRGIVIGYDGRYNSKTFAHLAARAFLSRGFRVLLFSEMVPTPYVPFTISHLGCAAGVVVTASHNPKQDNGFKVYWENGSQIVSPVDKRVAEAILRNLKPWADVPYYGSPSSSADIYSCENVIDPFADIHAAYQSMACEKYHWNTLEMNQSSPLKICYTAMHGVGHKFTKAAFEHFGLKPFVPTLQQIEPDPEFSTVAFPNPEEGKGALALAIKTADEHGCKVILANDPDADRLAVAERTESGEWRVLTGNEIGLLLANWTWNNYSAKGLIKDPKKCSMVASTVSSKALRALAHSNGFRFEETLTGFKWIGNKAYSLIHNEDNQFLFGYEVEIGFLVGDMSLDKDGVRVAAIFAEMSNTLYTAGSTLVHHLDSIYSRIGFFEMNTRYFFCYDPKVAVRIFDKIRNGGAYVSSIGGIPVKYVRDLTTGYDNSQPDHKAVLPVSSSSQMITFTFEDGSTCTLRNSGTEPKIKYYVECSDATRAVARAKVNGLTTAVIASLLEPEANGLIAPKD